MTGPLAIFKGPSGHRTGTRDGRGVSGASQVGSDRMSAGRAGPEKDAGHCSSGTWAGGPRQAASLFVPSELLEAPRPA